MSYDLNITGDGELDLDLARLSFGCEADCDEALWLRDTLSATVVFEADEIDVGIVGDEAPRAERARDFEELLQLVLDLAQRLGADVYDPQLGRELAARDVAEAVRGFA